MRAVAEILEVSRSNLIEQVQDNKIKTDRKTNDKFLLPLIREITDQRPTYGYRRVTVLLNRKLKSMNKGVVNHKRVYRIMKNNNLLLQRYGKKKTQTHDGTVITLKSNTRWCTDTFSVQCFNGDQVHVAFVMDTCDREVISYISSTIGVDGAMIRDLMVEAVEKRFQGATKLPHRVQWLSDNGPCYTSHETVNFGRMLGFDIRTTPSYSPESNGMSEALVKTTKRDYAWFADLSSAEVLMGQVPSWFEDYNENAPHKGLGMKSPREFIREQLAG